jgi:hypothetical protein
MNPAGIGLKARLWDAIKEYTEAVSYVEAFSAVHEVFVDDKALLLKAEWEAAAVERKKVVDVLIDSLLESYVPPEKIC